MGTTFRAWQLDEEEEKEEGEGELRGTSVDEVTEHSVSSSTSATGHLVSSSSTPPVHDDRQTV